MNNRTRAPRLLVVLACVAFLLACPASAAAGHTPANEADLLAALTSLRSHIEGRTKLDAAAIEARKLTIDKHRDLFGYNGAVIAASLDLVRAYDKAEGPLWVTRAGFDRKQVANDLPWTIYNVMQNIMDRAYTSANLAQHGQLLDGFRFGSSANFPGAVEPPADSRSTCSVKVDASYLKSFKHALMHEERPARRPTGAYLAPGTIATVVVPPAIVDKGYQVRVGAHSWDFSNKPRVQRLDRSSLAYAVDSTEVKVANPLGGGIYLEVPLNATAGVIELTIRNAVRAPFYSSTGYRQTSLDEWRNVERQHKAPWADFQSEKFMMQVPTSWINRLDDPAVLMRNWDAAMDAMNDLMGVPRVWGRESMYLQVDLLLRASVFAPGYPTVNDRYDPTRAYDGYVNHYLVRGPQYAPDYVFHEQGHSYLFVKFDGERESTVNLLHVAVWNQKFGYSLEDAFRASRGLANNPYRSLDNTAVEWMTSLNFAAKRPMTAGEKAYQLKGHAKFVDIARLFGWQALNDYWRSMNDDLEAGRPWSQDGSDPDKLSLRLSLCAGADLTPLLRFWGTPPRDAAALKASVAAAKLRPSARIFDALAHYRSLVPKDKVDFRDFATKLWGKQPSRTGYQTEREHAQQWDEYSEQTAAQLAQTVSAIMVDSFPAGRPTDR